MRKSALLTILGYLAAILVLSLGIYLITLKPPIVQNEVSIAMVIEVEGIVQRRSFLQATFETLKADDQIFDKDEVKTGKNSHVRLRFYKNDNDIKISEKTSAVLKSSAIKVNDGSIENESGGSNNFSFLMADIEIQFNKPQSSHLPFLKELPFKKLILQKMMNLSEKVKADEFIALRESFKQNINNANMSVSEYQKIWIQLQDMEKKYVPVENKLRFSFDKNNNDFKLKVDSGDISLKKAGEGTLALSKGQGVLSSGKGKLKKVKLLAAPRHAWPKDNGEVFNKTRIILNWEKLRGATTYLVEVSTRKDFSNLLHKASPSGNTIAVGKLQFGKTYYWKVQGVDQHQFEGDLFIRSFQVLEDRIPPKLQVDDIDFGI